MHHLSEPNINSSFHALCAFGQDYADHTTFGHSYSFSHNSHLSMSISVGGQPECHSATDLNEDSGAIVKFSINDYSLAIIADGHFGSHSSKIVIETILSALEYIPQHDLLTLVSFKDWLLPVLFHANSVILKKNMYLAPNYKSETTLSLVLATSCDFYWANFGDSRIYTTWMVEDHYDIAPVIHSVFLGRQMSKQYLSDNLYTGIVSWPPNNDSDILPCVIICSDGFPEVKSPDIDPAELVSWIGHPGNGGDACENVMSRAFAYNACDNLTCAIIVSPRMNLV